MKFQRIDGDWPSNRPLREKTPVDYAADCAAAPMREGYHPKFALYNAAEKYNLSVRSVAAACGKRGGGRKVLSADTKKEQIRKYGKAAQGRKELFMLLDGKKITRGQAVKAKCYDCMGYYGDGRVDCEQPDCGLYPYMPYAQN